MGFNDNAPLAGASDTISLVSLTGPSQPFFCWRVTMKVLVPGLGGSYLVTALAGLFGPDPSLPQPKATFFTAAQWTKCWWAFFGGAGSKGHSRITAASLR